VRTRTVTQREGHGDRHHAEGRNLHDRVDRLLQRVFAALHLAVLLLQRLHVREKVRLPNLQRAALGLQLRDLLLHALVRLAQLVHELEVLVGGLLQLARLCGGCVGDLLQVDDLRRLTVAGRDDRINDPPGVDRSCAASL
jgi:hypothetical protein